MGAWLFWVWGKEISLPVLSSSWQGLAGHYPDFLPGVSFLTARWQWYLTASNHSHPLTCTWVALVIGLFIAKLHQPPHLGWISSVCSRELLMLWTVRAAGGKQSHGRYEKTGELDRSFKKKKRRCRISLAVQWLGSCTSTSGCGASIPGWGKEDLTCCGVWPKNNKKFLKTRCIENIAEASIFQ